MGTLRLCVSSLLYIFLKCMLVVGTGKTTVGTGGSFYALNPEGVIWSTELPTWDCLLSLPRRSLDPLTVRHLCIAHLSSYELS